MKKKIVVVDDDDGIREAFEVILTDAGYDVQAESTPDCLTTIKPNALPDLILLDILLSGADGREVCKKLKSQKDTKDIPVVMISAHPKAEKSSLEAKADGFLPKPFEIDELLETIKKYTKKDK